MGGFSRLIHANCRNYRGLTSPMTLQLKGRDRWKRKSKRAFIPATSFLITVIGVQQKRKESQERANRKRMSTKAKMTVQATKPSQDVEGNVLAWKYSIYWVTDQVQEKTSN